MNADVRCTVLRPLAFDGKEYAVGESVDLPVGLVGWQVAAGVVADPDVAKDAAPKRGRPRKVKPDDDGADADDDTDGAGGE